MNKISKETEWFVKNLQTLQDNFADSVGGQIVTTDSEGNLITEMSGQQKVCKMIMETEEGKKECQKAYKTALSLVESQEESIFMDCYAGFASLWVPIKVEGRIVGSITGCGGRYERGKSEEDLKEYYKNLAEELGIDKKDEFVKAAVDEIESVTEEEMKERAERLAKLVGILAEETALRELFNV